jgi:threonine dehydrogenase-like Zn-dependent dehydrogenase
MKALAVFPARRAVRLIDHPEPAVTSPTGVKLRMLEVGICGTDREIVGFQYGTPPPGSEYLVLGHESLGEVIEVGPAVTRVKPGDLVVTIVRRPCPHPSASPARRIDRTSATRGGSPSAGSRGRTGLRPSAWSMTRGT